MTSHPLVAGSLPRCLIAALLLIVSAVAQQSASPFRPMVPVTGPLNFTSASAPGIDWNHDGYADAFSGYHGGIAVAYGLPGGGYGPYQVLITLPPLVLGFIVDAADLDGDGTTDLLQGAYDAGGIISHTYRVIRGDGAGGIASIEPLALSSTIVPVGGIVMFLLRVNGRTSPVIIARIVVRNGIERYVLQYYDWDPVTRSWPPAVITAIDPGHTNIEAEELDRPVVDFDGDGYFDWIWRVFDPYGTNLIPQSFGILRGLPQPPYIDSNFVLVAMPQPATERVLRVGYTDLNHDGRTDVVVTLESYTALLLTRRIAIALGHPTAGLAFLGNATPISYALLGAPAYGDCDSDELIDLAYTGSATGSFSNPQRPYELVVQRGKPDGTFSPPMVLLGGLPFANSFPLADVDQDGDLDMVGLHPAGYRVARNDSLMGTGTAAASGLTPRIRRGHATLGNADFFIAMDLAPASAPTVLAASLAPASSPGPIGVDLQQLLWPLGALGPTTTDFRGLAYQVIPLPTAPALAGAEIYFQWAVATPNAAGFALTQTARIVLWN